MKKYKKMFTCSLITFLAILIIGFIAFSTIIKLVISDQFSLKKRNLPRRFFEKLPINLELCVFFFNISNPDDVHRGQKPVLKEVGPYCYDAYKEKRELVDNIGEDSLSFYPHEIYIYNQEMTAPRSQDDYVTILNPLVVGLVNSVKSSAPQLLPVILQAMGPLLNYPTSIYFTVKVRDLLFDGVTLNCTNKHYSVRAVCSQLKEQIPTLDEYKKNIYRFSVFGPVNGTIYKRYKVSRGSKRIQDAGRIIEFENDVRQNVWLNDHCNKFRGTDSYIFPPFADKNEIIWVFIAGICKNIDLRYVEESKYRGVKTYEYHADFGDSTTDPELRCYCPKLKSCPKKGLIDLTKCLGVPIYLSLPHFLRADPTLLNDVKGLKPMLYDHVIRAQFEPLTSVPMEAKKRMQLNLDLQPEKKVTFMRNVPTLLHPLLWVQESIELKGLLYNIVWGVLLGLKIFKIIRWFILIGSFLGMAYSSFMCYTLKHEKELKGIVEKLVDNKSQISDKADSISAITDPKDPKNKAIYYKNVKMFKKNQVGTEETDQQNTEKNNNDQSKENNEKFIDSNPFGESVETNIPNSVPENNDTEEKSK